MRISPGATTQPSPDGTIARDDVLLAVGDGRFLTRALDRAELVIGRDPECDFAIDHPSLSRRHACVRLEPEVTIQDLGSTNGTRVDGNLLFGGAPVALRGRGNFEIGPFSFVAVSRTQGASLSLSGRRQLQVLDPSAASLPAVVREFARADANILIVGETGVGKELLATALHGASGRSGALIQINCAALSENLLENELFGHERGAFTGAVNRAAGLIEAAAGGTLFLDEIGEMPLSTQAKLLRVIERREVMRLGATRAVAVDVRFLAATNRDLRAEVAQRRFREDLYFRLDGVTLEIPPLRARRGMIVPLAMGFLTRVRGAAPAELAVDAVEALEAHRWPGNVRELKAVIERAAVLARGGPVSARHLMLAQPAAPEPIAAAPVVPAPAVTSEEDAERERIVQALAQCAGNQSRAAKLLGISRTTMITKLRIYKIRRPTDQ